MSYNAKVYMKQGGDELVVGAGGKITAAGTQAASACDVSRCTAVIAIIAALEGVGILTGE